MGPRNRSRVVHDQSIDPFLNEVRDGTGILEGPEINFNFFGMEIMDPAGCVKMHFKESHRQGSHEHRFFDHFVLFLARIEKKIKDLADGAERPALGIMHP